MRMSACALVAQYAIVVCDSASFSVSLDHCAFLQQPGPE